MKPTRKKMVVARVIPMKGGMFLLHNPPPGTCQECAVAHEPDQPHNQQSLAYQYKFYADHKRWPTWADAMAHCTPEVRALWLQALAEKGVKITRKQAQAALKTAKVKR